MLIVLFAMKMARNDQASFSFPSGKKKGGGKKERQKLPTDRAPLGGKKKIDTEDKGISFPVGERSTLKGSSMLGGPPERSGNAATATKVVRILKKCRHSTTQPQHEQRNYLHFAASHSGRK